MSDGSNDPEDEFPAIIIDNGSAFTKTGFITNHRPRIFPTVVGRLVTSRGYSTYGTPYEAYSGKKLFAGADAKPYLCLLKYPIEYGMINNWDDMETIWHYTFYDELKTTPEEHGVLLTETPLNPKNSKKKAIQIMFETFNVEKYYTICNALLSLFAMERTTGIVLQSGDMVSHCVPIYESYTLPHAIQRINLGGRDISDYLYKLLNKNKSVNLLNTFYAYERKNILKDMKEKLCYIALEAKNKVNINDGMEIKYTLPDENVITLNDEMLKVTECLFKPELIGLDGDGLHKILYQSINNVDVECRKDLYENIVISGGNTMFTAFENRLINELKSVSSDVNNLLVDGYLRRQYSKYKLCDDIKNIMYKYSIYRCNVINKSIKDLNKCNQLLPWIGATTLCSLSTFEEMWIIKNEYDEYGPSIVLRKCYM
eukprot:146822_1